MREIRQLVTILLVVQIVVTLGISMQQVASCEPQVESFLLAPKVSYKLAASDPITIGLNSHFQDYASQGDGTEGSPYVIEGYSININCTAYSYCISIMNTDAHFIIRDCEFIGKKYAAEYDPSVIVVEGILLQFENVRNGLVENCTFTALQSKRGNAYRSSRPKPRDG